MAAHHKLNSGLFILFAPCLTQRQCEGLVPLHDVGARDADQTEVELPAELHGVVTVGQHLLQPLGRHPGHLLQALHPPPVHDARLDEVHQLK